MKEVTKDYFCVSLVEHIRLFHDHICRSPLTPANFSPLLADFKKVSYGITLPNTHTCLRLAIFARRTLK